MRKNGNLKRLTGISIAMALLLSVLPGYSPVFASVTAASGAIETFEDAAFATDGVEGTTLFTGTADRQDFDIGDNLHLIIQGEGTKVEILTDPVTSSRAMKITHPGSGTIQVLNYYGGNANTGTYITNKIIKTGCKVRLVSQKDTSITRFNRIDSNGVTASGNVIWNKKFCGYSGSVLEIDGAETMSASGYVSTSVTFNFATKKAVRESGNAKREDTETTTPTQFNRTWYRFEAPSSGYTSDKWKGTDANTTEIWLDDLFFETYAYEPQISVAGKAGAYKNGASYTSASLTDIPLNAPIEVKFNGECGESAESAGSYTLKDSSANDVPFTVERFADNIITVYPKYQIGGETYTFTAKAGIVSAENAAIDTRTARSVTYTTVTNGLSFRGFVESESFDNIAETTYTATSASSSFLGGKIAIRQNASNNTIGVSTDALTGNKALRIYINNHNSTGKYLWVLPEAYTSGRFVTTFDVRMASLDVPDIYSYFMSFGNSSVADGRSDGWTNKIRSYNYWTFGYNGTAASDQWTSKSNWDSSVYFPAMMSIDFASTTFSGQVYRKYGTDSQSLISKTSSFASASNCNNLKYIQLAMLKKRASDAAASEIYIDNLRVARYDFDDFVVGNVALSGNAVQAELYNYTGAESPYMAIAVQLDGNGNIACCNMQSGTISSESVDIDIDFDDSAVSYELYVWDDIEHINALTKKISISGS